jgi:hypothetical protein
MNITDARDLFTEALAATRISAPDGTHLGKVAAAVMEMSHAYESDGITFFTSGDPVNSLASFYYGFGWLHFGTASGLLFSTRSAICPFRESQEPLRTPFRTQLEEKTCRYAYLLDCARRSVRCAPDPATTSYDFARRILCVAGVYARRGGYLVTSGSYEDALAGFSYGHGWLDAGVTAGFFCIEAERDLFCV